MIYLQELDLMSRFEEEDFLNSLNRTCFYPFGLFTQEKGLTHIEFSDITKDNSEEYLYLCR